MSDCKVIDMILENQKEMKVDMKELKKGQQEILLARAEEKGRMKIIAGLVSAIISGLALVGYSFKDYLLGLFS